MRHISISIVSHLQSYLVADLLADIEHFCAGEQLEVILTLNAVEELPFTERDFSFLLIIIRNSLPLGFGANHNRAFAQATAPYFCVMNPDIRLLNDPFAALLLCLSRPYVGVVAPMIVDEKGKPEDSARRFPTPLKICCKALGGCNGTDYFVKEEPIYPDWVGGMFMLFHSEMFKQLGGFNQRYFLYYEDVDLCARLKLHGYMVAMCPAAKAIHHAQRRSHRSLKYFKWHLTSMMRFFFSSIFLKICWLRLRKKLS